ncbi:MAG TPA: tRNA pseudouridine synthase A [Acidimicrobiia bacterium]|nr:tRNA pseudouridine synthase A [Acidimicrobiia bacterium]
MAIHRIDLAYDGTGFRGWARNAGVRTVQEELETALARVLGETVTLSVAGRTDAGVHARHQVASFPFEGSIDPEGLVRSLRTMLGPEVAIHSIGPAPEGFDARFSAVRRSYRYFIDEGPSHDPLQARWVWHRGEPLDLEAMDRAAVAFVGAHDFASLCRASDSGSSERTVEGARWDRSVVRRPSSVLATEVGSRQQAADADGRRKTEDESLADGGLLVFAVSARAFCHQMVRSMVALCVEVGRGRLAAEAVPGILEARDRNAARGVAPAHGLVLWGVEY